MADSEKILQIKRYPDPVLRKKCADVLEITPREKKMFEDMLATMYASGGIGLAAPQVGKSAAMIVADAGAGAIRLANPCIISSSGEDKLSEGCLSVPDVNVGIKRPTQIIVEGLNENNERVKLKLSGLIARVVQHEMDHLKGRLIIDYLGLIDKMLLFKLRKRRIRCRK